MKIEISINRKKFKKRRPLWERLPDLYKEPDKAYVNNNLELCCKFLEKVEKAVAAADKITRKKAGGL